jgi:hypothetical protein
MRPFDGKAFFLYNESVDEMTKRMQLIYPMPHCRFPRSLPWPSLMRGGARIPATRRLGNPGSPVGNDKTLHPGCDLDKRIGTLVPRSFIFSKDMGM